MPALRAFRLLLLALLIAAAPPARAAGEDTTRQTLETARAALADIDAALKADNLADADLVRLRAEGDPLAAELQAVITELAPRLEASQKRLAELTPKSKDVAVERFGERGTGRRTAKTRRARRRRAFRARDAAADRRRQRANRRGAARPLRARNLRALFEPPQSAAVDGGGARSARRRRARSGPCSAIGFMAWRRGSPARRRSAFSRWSWRSRRCGRRCNGSRGA